MIQKDTPRQHFNQKQLIESTSTDVIIWNSEHQRHPIDFERECSTGLEIGKQQSLNATDKEHQLLEKTVWEHHHSERGIGVGHIWQIGNTTHIDREERVCEITWWIVNKEHHKQESEEEGVGTVMIFNRGG